MRPNPLIPTRTGMSSSVWVVSSTYSRASRAFANRSGSCTRPSARRHVGRDRLHARFPDARLRLPPCSRPVGRPERRRGRRARGRPGDGRSRPARPSPVSVAGGWRPGRPAREHRSPRHGSSLTQRTGSRLVYSDPGASTIWSASSIAVTASAHAGASSGTSSTRRMRPALFGTATCPSTASPSTSAFSTTGSVGRRKHPAHGVEQAARFVERGSEVAERLGKPDDDEVAERVATQLAAAEAMLERFVPDVVVTGQRDEAPAQVTRRRHAEVASQASRRSHRRPPRSPPR